VRPVLFHNGSLWHWEKECLEYMLNRENTRVVGHMNDSRFVAIQMSRLKNEEEALNFLQKQSGKYLLMKKNVVHLIGSFEEHEGVHFSNSSYKPFKKYYGVYDWRTEEKAKKHYEKWSKGQKEKTGKYDYENGYFNIGWD